MNNNNLNLHQALEALESLQHGAIDILTLNLQLFTLNPEL